MSQQNFKFISFNHILKRICAGLIDYAVIFVVWFILISISDKNEEGRKQLSVFFSWTLISFWFFWMVAIEQAYDATVGNMLMGFKVVSLKNPYGKLTWKQSFLRHLVDTLDMFLGLFVVLLMSGSGHRQRLGDFLAGTKVISVVEHRNLPSEKTVDRPRVSP